MVGGQFQGSQDNSTWTTLYTITTAPGDVYTTAPTSADPGTFRYLRYLAPDGAYGNVAEVEFDSNGVKLTGTPFGTPGSWNSQGNDLTKALDGDTTTYFDAPDPGNGDYVGIDQGPPASVTAGQVRYFPRATWESRMVGGQFQGSQDNSTWTTLYTVTTTPSDVWTTAAISTDPKSFRYLRYLAPDGSYGNVAEIEFASGTGTNAVKRTGTPFGTPGSYTNDGNDFTKALDGDTTTYFDAPDPGNGDYIGIDQGSQTGPPPPAPAPYGGSPVTIASSGTTKIEAENYDLGGQGVAYHDTDNGGQTSYRADNIGVYSDSASNGFAVGWAAAGEWDGYTLNVAKAGVYTLGALVATPNGGGTFHLEFGPVGQVGGAGVIQSSEFTTPNTGGWGGSYQPVAVATVSLPAGPLWMRLVVDSTYACNFDCFTLAPASTLTSITVSPPTVTLNPNGTQQFTAVANDQNGNALSPQPTFTWSVASGGVGTINSSNGLYSAGATTGSAIVTATSGTVSGTATATVTNAAPTVATAAAANPNPVTGTTTTLSVLGADDGGEPALTYTWATIGTPPAAVTFSANGTNAAKNTTATFTKVGTYSFQVTITDAGGLTVTSSVSVAVSQTLQSIVVTPNPVMLNLNATQQFTATTSDQFGNPLTTSPAFIWSVVSGGVGMVTSTGSYSGGAMAGSAMVTATSGSISGSATVTVTNVAPTVATTAAANPGSVTGTATVLSVLGADDGGEANLTYTWATTGTPPASVTFSANGTNAAKNATATFTKAGSYSFQVTITDAGGLTATSTVTVTVISTPTSIAVSPPTATMNVNATQLFAAMAQDQFGTALTTQPTISWTAAGGGSITPGTGASATYIAPATVPSGSVTVTAASGSIHGTAAVTVQSNTSMILRVDAGSTAAYTDVSTNVWSADNYFTGGTVEAPATPPTIANTSDQKLYQTQRVGTSFSYALPIANGKYILGLSFAEIDGSAAGQRVFNVTANGTTVLTSFDIYAAAGGANKAVGRAFPVTVTNGQLMLTFTGTTGQAAVSAISLLPPSPALDIPAPGWAEDVLPTDDASDADGMGPAAASSVNLASGVEENSPGPDLWAFNPLGPSASYERRYRSARAQKGYASPGLSPGWTDGYDLVVTPTGSGYTLTYDNGGQDHWTGTTGSLGTPAGAPYLVTASGSTITMTFKDRSKYIFTQISGAGGNYSANSYLLTGIINLVGHAITLNRDMANGYRVTSITNDAPTPATLLFFAYNGDGTLQSVTDPVGGRQVTYGFSGGSLSTASQIAATGTINPPTRWQYGYTSVMSASLLNSVSAPDPSNPGSLVAAVTAYDPLTGTVSQHQDASGRVHSYGYMSGQTLVQVNNSDGSLAESWTQKQNTGGGMNADSGTTDAAGKADSVAYGGMSSPYLPTAATNRNSQTSKVAYNDNYGNVLSTTGPRGVVSTFSYANPSDFPLNEVASVQPTHVNASGTTDSTQTATTFDYYGATDVPADNGPAGTINGMIKAVHSPTPGTVNYSVTVTTAYTYDSLGNVIQTTTPNANYAVSKPGTPTYRTTTYNYTSYSFTDAKGTLHSYSQPEALGEPVSVTVSGLDYRATNSGSLEYTSAPQTTSTTTTYYQYDSRGNRTAVIDALGNETDFLYNLADQLTDTLYPATGDSGTGRAKTTTAYQYPGGPAAGMIIYDESGNQFRQVGNVYDADGELVSVSGNTYPVMYSYDGRGRVSSVTYYQQSIMNGSTTYYDYDAVGNLADIRYPNQTGANFDKRQYAYDADNNLIKEIDGLGLEKDYLRADPESLMTGIHYAYPSGYAGTQIADVGFTYDVFGRRASMTDGTGSKTYSYGDRDYLTNETVSFNNGPQNHIIKFAYNSDGSRVSRQTQLQLGTNSLGLYGQTADEFYDGVGRTINVDSLETDSGYNGPSTVENYAYYGNGWLQNANNPYGYQAKYAYNPRGFLAGLTNTLGSYQSSATASQFTGMAYDPAGNLLSETATIPSHPGGYGYNFQDASRSLLYSYNSRDELTGEQSQSIASSTNTQDSYAENYSYGFGYDLAGNSTTFKGAANSFNADNQSGTVTPDGNGNPTTYQGSTFSYDPEDRLASIPGMATMAYDGDGLRAWKQDSSGTRTYYLYDGDELFREEFWPGSATGNPQSLYVRSYASGPSGQIFCVKNNIETSDGAQNTSSARAYLEFYDYDPQGNLVHRLQNYNPAPVIDTAVYDAFGTLHGYAFDGTGIATSPGQSNYRTTPFRQGFGSQHGYYTDTQTGLQLLTHRYYDAGTGRFVTRDPLGYKGGINLYGFTGNNPVNESDPNGTDSDAFDPFAYFNDLFSHASPLGVLRSIKNSISNNGNFNLARNAMSEAGGIAATYNPYSGEDVIGARVLEAAGPWIIRGANTAKAARATVRFERYGSEAEATASKSAGKLLARPGHEAGTNEKWIGEVGTVNAKRLGSKSGGHSHRMEIETNSHAMEWLRKNATIKPNEPGRYGIPNSKLDEFNKMIKNISIKQR